ncbi:MAG: BCCT family transporter [Pseudomonadota bacterium]|nr:BCCT family transporter [Pseudomonadota bacterium]
MLKNLKKIAQKKNDSAEIDRFIVFFGSALLLTIVITIVLNQEWSETVIQKTFDFITYEFGILYIIIMNIALIFLGILAFGKHGKIILGPPDTKKDYSTFSWASMLFCTGIGGAILYWGATEWVSYYQNPPYSITPKSDEAIIWATSYGSFHWGPLTWTLYTLPAVAFCISYHHKQIPILRLSAACSGILGSYSEKWPGKIIDLFFITGLIGTSATGLAFAVELTTSCITKLSGLQDTKQMQLFVMFIITILIAYSVYKGLNRGIRVLSVINARFALLLIFFVFIVGPTTFILEMGVTSISHIAQNIIKMLTWTDPLEKGNFVEQWTVFYCAWAIALGPFIGMFIAKISKGRSLREVIFGMMCWGSLGCSLFFIILGNYSLDLELSGQYPVVDHVNQFGQSSAIAAIIELLPMGSLLLVFLAIIGVIFAATTYDSASYALAAGSTKRLKADEEPQRNLRIYWAVFMGLLPSALLFIGGLETLKTATIMASFPILFIYILLMLSMRKMLKSSSGKQ